jgi:hypothetical protein
MVSTLDCNNVTIIINNRLALKRFLSIKKKHMTQTNNLIRRYIIVGERRLSNYWWAMVIFLGSCGFLFTGISSFYQGSLPFFPQGLLMSFYGSLGFLLTIYWGFLIFWNVGGGFNEFNKKDGFVRIFRWGYPGKNRKIDLSYKITDVEAIRVELKQGLDPQRTIYLIIKAQNPNKDLNAPLRSSGAVKREIPLTGIGQPLTLKEIEKQASELANFLQVSLEG